MFQLDEELQDLLKVLLAHDPKKRAPAHIAKKHNWFTKDLARKECVICYTTKLGKVPVDDTIMS